MPPVPEKIATLLFVHATFFEPLHQLAVVVSHVPLPPLPPTPQVNPPDVTVLQNRLQATAATARLRPFARLSGVGFIGNWARTVGIQVRMTIPNFTGARLITEGLCSTLFDRSEDVSYHFRARLGAEVAFAVNADANVAGFEVAATDN